MIVRKGRIFRGGVGFFGFFCSFLGSGVKGRSRVWVNYALDRLFLAGIER